MNKAVFAGLFSFVGLLVLPIATAFIWVRAHSGCDVHDQNSSLSPDGTWQATWSTEGCYAVLLTTSFDSKVTVLKNVQPATSPYLVFESDSPDSVVFSWPSRAELHIEVPSIATIARSERNVPGLSVSYGVTKSALRELDDNQGIFEHKKGAIEDPRLSLADRKTAERVDADYNNYLDRFRNWTRDYALTATSGH